MYIVSTKEVKTKKKRINRGYEVNFYSKDMMCSLNFLFKITIKQKVIIMKNNVLLICVCLFIFSCTNNMVKEEFNSPNFSFESTQVYLGNIKKNLHSRK